MSRPLAFLLLAAITVAAPVTRAAGKPPANQSAKPISTEQLMAVPPKGWKLGYQMNAGTTRLTDFVPPGETDGKWKTKLTFEAHADLKGSDPLKVVLGEVASERQMCSFVQDFNLFTGLENNYRTSARLILCGRNKFLGKGEVSIFKAIDGKDYFYIIRLAKQIAPFKKNQSGFDHQEMADWSNYFSKIVVCDPSSHGHPCPRPAKH